MEHQTSIPPVSRHSPPSAAPLTHEHLEQLSQAKLRAKKIRTACTVATVNGSILAVFAGCSLLIALLGFMFGQVDILGLVMGGGLGFLAWNEFRGREMLRRFEVVGCRVLGWNQLCVLGLVVAYAAWMVGNALWGPSPYDAAIAREPMLAGSLGSIGDLYKTITVAIYGGLIAGTLIFQGINSLYYFTRAKHLAEYVNQTPDWVLQAQRRGVV